MYYNKRLFILSLFLTTVKFQMTCCKDNENQWEGKTVVKQGLSSEFPLDFGQVLDDATNVFGKVVGKMLSKKRLLGIDVNKWYW